MVQGIVIACSDHWVRYRYANGSDEDNSTVYNIEKRLDSQIERYAKTSRDFMFGDVSEYPNLLLVKIQRNFRRPP